MYPIRLAWLSKDWLARLVYAYLAAARFAALACLATHVRCAIANGPYVMIHDGPTFTVAQRDSEPALTTTNELPLLNDCKPFDLEPLASLTTDIYPIDRPGQVELTNEQPQGCFSYALSEAPVFLGGGLHGPECDLLKMTCGWQFCHRPLYFEERCLERYGRRTCCFQPAASAIHFYGTALLLPIKIIQQPCCRVSVRTPCY